MSFLSLPQSILLLAIQNMWVRRLLFKFGAMLKNFSQRFTALIQYPFSTIISLIKVSPIFYDLSYSNGHGHRRTMDSSLKPILILVDTGAGCQRLEWKQCGAH